MSHEQVLIIGIIALTVAAFLWSNWRHDMVALGSLLACVFTGLVPSSDAFAGFGHPAVITVGCVLVLSRGLQTSGAVNVLTQRLLPGASGPTVTIGALTGLGALLSAFMNNVGAMALLMPVAIQIAAKQGLPPGRVLMPLAFGSILGGMTTLIGTPPNLIVSGFRAKTGENSFAMFDFTPVGLAVAGSGVLFVVLVGWRLVPARERAGVEGFDTGAYLTEALVTAGSKVAGKTVTEAGQILEEAEAQIVGMVRRSYRMTVPNPTHVLRDGDILVIEAEPESLTSVLSKLGLKLAEDASVEKPAKEDADQSPEESSTPPLDTQPARPESAAESDDLALIELAVRPGSFMIGRSAKDVHLRARFGINLLALSRQGRRSIRRLRSERVQPGDVLLMQGPPPAIMNFANEFGCVPLAERALVIPNRRQAFIATMIMGTAIAGAAFGLMPAAISFAAGVLASMAFRVVSPRTVYESVDWPVIVLLAALIPVAAAMATTGAADVVAEALLNNVAQGNAIVSLALILVVTMTLSDFVNNAATAAVMCPIAISTATQLQARPDSFLMAVAIGASCAFLTPIGHQNNTLILGPGGLHFGDYWRLGLPVEILVIAISIPMLLIFWPL